ncbi:hypothetical protein AGABI1DRAFT_109971 [Agaricus bisporus var. burnettii JB137-S8]|uniref:Transcription factor TFIIIC triple barrel domain-containing protein n=1 Tax=Agaricus bisporus var. burnettii (strain JB137-S8 / ATCC MYA-4627 / FGSC 10392) TaxID=597362 RepID=K5XIE3_AGABU|nr:uncharacterized protein AGABI1DRAFT_109971 [Agaricus bisporus var. burnettii JB137-S8]EKM74215.1 hypothetical protein AGABI1DRAFT_109971 [Agaricus bisporus var. burnettii JB137-S8]
MDPPRTTLCPGYSYVEDFSPSLSSPKQKFKRIPADSNPDVVAQGAESETYEPIEDEEGEESEYEEEIEYVVLDLGNTEPTLVPSSQTYRLIGLDTPTPYLQLSGTILQGRHENLLGSELLFTDDKGYSGRSIHLDAMGKKKSVTHVSTTSKRISFKEVRLRPKEQNIADEEPMSEEERRDEDIDIDDAEGEREDEGVDFDMRMNLDEDVDAERGDALEYVDFGQANAPSHVNVEAGPSHPPPTPTHGPPPSPQAQVTRWSEHVHLKSHSKNKGKGKAKASPERASHTKETGAEEEEESTDPAMQIDRLTGVLPTVARAPNKSGSKMKSREKGKGKSKGKQKETTDD